MCAWSCAAWLGSRAAIAAATAGIEAAERVDESAENAICGLAAVGSWRGRADAARAPTTADTSAVEMRILGAIVQRLSERRADGRRSRRRSSGASEAVERVA